jgi:succinoglycan biosynthesis transport protein ExoP
MLHNQRTSALPDSSLLEQGGENSGPDLANLALGFLRRQYLLIIVTTVLALTASVVVLRFAPPTYTAQLKLLIGGSKAPIVQQQAMQDETPIDLESQIEILKSKPVATSVINQLNLADDPEFSGKGVLHSALKAIRRMLGITSQGLNTDLTDGLIEEFEKRLSAGRLGGSSVIGVSFESSNAERAAEIANAIARAYMDDQLKAKTDGHRIATAWLRDRLQELGHDALAAQRAVDELKAKSNIVAADGKLIDEQQVADLNRRLVVARTHTSEVMTRLNRFESVLASNNFDAVSLGNIDAVSSGNISSPNGTMSALGGGIGVAGDTIGAPGGIGGPGGSIGAPGGINAPQSSSISAPAQNNQIITSLRLQYLEYARREYEYSAKYGNDHLAVVNLRATMKSIRHAIMDEVRRLAEGAKSDFEEAKQQQQEIEKQLAQAVSQSQHTSAAALSIRELETSAKGYRSLYESFLQRYMGSLQQASFPISEARVISPAAPPQKKSKPSPKLLLALGMFGGIALGSALGFLREMKDRGFRTSAQIEDRLRLPCLSVVPLLRHRKVRKVNKKSAVAISQADKESGQRTFFRGSGTCGVATAMPSSRFAESIRSIRFALDLDPTKTPTKVVGLTSTLPNEGKSTIAASLAQLLASSGKRVIVVDCDLRNPSLSANLTPDAGAGITDILLSDRSLEDTVWTDTATGLDFLPGRRAPLSNTSDILCTAQAKKLFEQLRATYDYVIVDLPPLAPIIDVRATTPLMDSFILVVEWGRTTTDVVEHALNTAPNVYDALLGIVLNKTDMKAMKRYAHHYGDYYNDEHYIRYGQLTAE